MPYIFIFFSELCLLAILTRHSSSYFLKFFHSITGSEKASIILFSIIFFPGTLIHELAHFLMAKILFVHTSGMEFLPQIQGDAIKLGSVSIAKTDLLRRTLIGVAPVLVGLLLVLGGLGLVERLGDLPWWGWVLAGYLVFVVSSTMFSSRKDLEGSFWVVVALIVLVIALYFFGFDWVLLSLYLYLTTHLNHFFQHISFLLLIPLGINFAIVFLNFLGKYRLT